MRMILVMILSGLVIASFTGCASSVRSRDLSGSTMLEPQTLLKFSDVPIPVGFQIIQGETYIFESAGVRVGVLKYRGKANIEQITAFYKEQMPMYNWHLLNMVEYGDRLLNFDRDAETCIVNLSPRGSATIITISVGPKSQARKRSDRVLK